MAGQNCLNTHLDGEALYKLAAPDTAGQNLLDRIANTKNWARAENTATAIRWCDIAF